MAIIILNVTEKYGKKYGEGVQVYEPFINRQLKCMFTHEFEDGLSACLRRAADAFEYDETGEVKGR